MHTSCIIKVSDLLRRPSSSDELVIEDCMIDAIPHLRVPGVSALCRFQSTSDGTIVVTLSDITATIDDICDLSGESYIRDIHITSYEWKFSPDVVFHDDPYYVYEDDFPFLSDGESINIEDMIIQSIILQEPLVHIKPGKEIILSDNDSSLDGAVHTWGTISFRYIH